MYIKNKLYFLLYIDNQTELCRTALLIHINTLLSISRSKYMYSSRPKTFFQFKSSILEKY